MGKIYKNWKLIQFMVKKKIDLLKEIDFAREFGLIFGFILLGFLFFGLDYFKNNLIAINIIFGIFIFLLITGTIYYIIKN